MTLAELKKVQIVGNAYHDMQLMRKISDFICDTNNAMSERLEAGLYLTKDIMGCDADFTEKDIEEMMKYN